MPPEYQFLIIEDPDFYIDSPEKLSLLYARIGAEALDNAGCVVIFKLNEVT